MGPVTASADTGVRGGEARFAALDSWRGIAALLVALLHFRFLGHFYSLDFVRNSWLFVDFFFVLSGFVITHAYADYMPDHEQISLVARAACFNGPIPNAPVWSEAGVGTTVEVRLRGDG